MTEKQLLEIMRGIKTEYILDAAPKPRRRKTLAVSLIAAACAVAILCSAIFVPMLLGQDPPPDVTTEPPQESTAPPNETTDIVIDPEGPIVITDLISGDIDTGTTLTGFRYWHELYVSSALEYQFSKYEMNNVNGIFILVVCTKEDDLTMHTDKDIKLFEDAGFAVRVSLGKMHVIGTMKQFAELSTQINPKGYVFTCPTIEELHEAFPQNYLPDNFELDTLVTGFNCSKIFFYFDSVFDVSAKPQSDAEVYSLMYEIIDKFKSRESCLEFWIFKNDNTKIDLSELEEMHYIKYNTTSYFLDDGVAILVKFEDISMQAIRYLSCRDDIMAINILQNVVTANQEIFIIN